MHHTSCLSFGVRFRSLVSPATLGLLVLIESMAARAALVNSSYSASVPSNHLTSQVTPVNVAFDDSYVDIRGNYHELVEEASTSGGGVPTAHVQGQSTDWGFSGIAMAASAGVTYQVAVQRRGPLYPSNLTVPVRVTAAGFADATMTDKSGTGGNVSAGTRVEFGLAISDQYLAAAAAANIGDHATDSFVADFTANLGVGARVAVTLFAGGYFAIANGSLSGDFQAAADPRFEIDPTAVFMLNGEQVRFTDAYLLEYSPGIDPPPVPEPLTLELGAMGIAAVAHRRCRRRREGW